MELKKSIEMTDVFNNESLLEELIKLPFKEDTRPLTGVSLKHVKFARRVEEVLSEIKNSIQTHIHRTKSKDKADVNGAFRLIIGNFVYSTFERKPLTIPNDSRFYLPDTRLAKLFLKRQATRDVIKGLKEAGYIKLNRKGLKVREEANNYIPTDKLRKLLIPLIYCVVEEYEDSRFKEYIQFKEESTKERILRIKKEKYLNKQQKEQSAVSRSVNTMQSSTLPDDHPDVVNLRKVNNFLKDVTYALKSPIKLTYLRDFLHGGRLYTAIQNLPMRKAEVRINTLINGEPVVEIDFSASFARIAAAVNGKKELPEDPYTDVAKIAGVTRGQVKFLFTRALGSNSRRIDLKDKVEPENSISKDERIRIENATMKLFPEVYAAFYVKHEPSGSLYQSLEGQILLKTMARLAELKIPALPIHDSLMVPKKDYGSAEILLKKYWRETLNVEFDPVVTIDKP
jgi:hypothetical protein